MENQFIFDQPDLLKDSFNCKWRSPSNIALVKYWGKTGVQIPANPSISFTLKNCNTETEMSCAPSDSRRFEIWSDGKRKVNFESKIKTFFQRIEKYCPFVKKIDFKFSTTNTFPHSSGIASSASGFSALALCIMSIEKQLNPNISENYFMNKASFLARLGSGSASRSLFKTMASWGKAESFLNSSDLFATEFSDVHEVFKDYKDAVLLIDEGQKKVSSTVGHNLMHDHPYAEKRFAQADTNMTKIKSILKSGDLDEFVKLVESEALTLHSMMMTSMPYFILMKPNTLKAIEKIWEYRAENNSHICFTLDAGANVHVLYPANESNNIEKFIKNDLSTFCEDGKVIFDQVGEGAKQIV